MGLLTRQRQPARTPNETLQGLVAKLNAAQARLDAAERDVQEAERERAQAEANLDDDPAEGLRVRAAADERAVQARKTRDYLAEMRKARFAACDAHARKLAEVEQDKCDKAAREFEAEREKALARADSLEQALLHVDARRQSYGFSGENWFKLRLGFDPGASRSLERIERDRLRARARDETEAERAQRHEREADTALAVQAPWGAAYTRLRGDGGPVPLKR